MPVREDKGWLFIHVPKTGGTSIRRVLGMGPNNPLWSGAFGHEWEHCTLEMARRLGYWNCFSFAFVRNPFDRFVSEWVWQRETRDLDMTFRAFAQDTEKRLRVGLGYTHIRPQSGFFPKGSLDFVGRFERFEEDARDLFERLGLNTQHVPHLNGIERASYQPYYDEETKALVRATYRKDLERFDYSFEEEEWACSTQ